MIQRQREEEAGASKIFDGIILDWSTWKFFGGRSLNGLFPSLEQAKDTLNELAKKENNSISAFKRILKEDGFLAFDNSLPNTTSTSKDLLDFQLNNIKKHIYEGKDLYIANLSDHYTDAVFKENFKEYQNISKDFETIIDGETIPPFTPEGNDMFKTEEEFNKLNFRERRERFFARFPKNEVIK